MAGLVPAISITRARWPPREMPGTRPGMTPAASFHRRHSHRDGANVVAAIDDLAAFVRTDVAAVARLHDRLFAAGDHGQLTSHYIIDLLRRRSVGTGASARQEVRDAEDE